MFDKLTFENGTVTSLVKGILDDTQALFKQQLELVKYEFRDDLRKTRDAGFKWGAGVAAAAVSGVMFANMLVQLLCFTWPELPLWGSYGIVGTTLFLLAGALVWWGTVQFESVRLLPVKSAQALEENLQCITHPTTSR